ncbi:lysophospholipid acyltransferase family protein [Desulfopila inferna]|uniref:lysophospholipid acyltransferase family protein n=1 Tax=Desulfopila inferna TaxID=468528 RepID=UPI001F053035|nr:lysophospholipid acyltransferase family protein [Desulfopila inferna]
MQRRVFRKLPIKEDLLFTYEPVMHFLDVRDSRYLSVREETSFLSKVAPSLVFYPQLISVVYQAAAKAKNGSYSENDWALDSLRVLRLLEKAGLQFSISGLQNLEKLDGPCVFIGNHMSIMETLILPVIIVPYTKVTFVVKESLLDYPVFKYVMRSRNPVAVTRTNPRQDLKKVMSEGVDRLQNGISVIVFPQTTRSTTFDPLQFGSIGTKLAGRADVPIIPMALKTDAWRNGKFTKDLGKLCPEIPVKTAFGEPLRVSGKGAEQHQQVADFIQSKLQEWK